MIDEVMSNMSPGRVRSGDIFLADYFKIAEIKSFGQKMVKEKSVEIQEKSDECNCDIKKG